MANVGIFEYDLEEMMHADKLVFLDLTFPEDAEYLMSKWGCAARGSPCTFEVRFKTPEGQGIWVLAAVIPVFENGVVTSVSGCTTNIHDTKLRETESVQRLQALERAKAWERRFANFAEMAPIAIYFGSQRHHQFSYCNRAWFEMTGHPVVPFDQIDWASIVYEEDIELVRSSWTRVFSTQNHTTVQYRLRRSWADGNGVTIGPVWVTASALPEYNEDGSIKGIIGTMLDISALKFAETVQQMKVQEALEAKRQSSNFIDMTSHEIRNPLGAVFHCSDATQETLADMTVLANKLASTTESKIGEQLRELIANGVDSVSTIISCSQHQKRIVDDILVLSKLDSNLLQISPSSVRVTTLLRDVEKMFEAEAQRSDVQLETQAHASLEQMEVNWVLLDPGRVQQVLINLLTNAIKFCKKKNQRKVTIRIGASKIRPSENVLPNIDFVVAHSLHDSVYDDPKFESQSFYLWFSVEDTGRGMSADEKSRIFARFTQGSPRTESEYGGSGLGLFISRELAELQGGEIGVASELHVGSTFAFFVKTRHTEAPVTKTLHKNLTLQQKEQQTQATKKSDINILVVEDNAVNQKLLRQQLSKHGFTVTTADNGVDCLSQLQKTKHWRANSATSAPSVEVILMDIEMPLMDGLQATREIRKLEKEGKLTGHVPIIAVSANARQEQRDLAMDAGMDDSISKPFRIAELVPKIERLAGWT
ncbi:putative histidine kinase HHK19p, partial [Aureobasidium melanogenum]